MGLLRKLLAAEPDNLRVHVRLADLLQAAGKPAEAVTALRATAELLHRRGEHAEALEYADRALKTAPDDLPTLTLKARMLAAGSHRSDAIALLQALPGLDEGGQTAELLIDLYLEAGEAERASDLAARIFARNSKLFGLAHHVAATLLEGDQPDRALPLLDLVREAMTGPGEHEQLSESLARAAEQLPGRIEPREWLVKLYAWVSDSFRLPDALTNLAEACEAAGQYERAQRAYEKILDGNPENEAVRRSYDRIRVRLGHGEEAPQQASESVEPQRETLVSPEPALDEETERLVTQTLIDVDLFSSYGLTQKAIELLETVLHRAPQHTPSLERLLDLYLGTGNERLTAELAAQLQQIHNQRGDDAAADRFGTLRRRFERAAGFAPGEVAASPAPAPAPERSAADAEAQPSVEAGSEPLASDEAQPAGEEVSAEPVVREVDLSEEWAALANQVADKSGDSGEIPSSLAPEAIPAESTSAGLTDDFSVEAAPEYELELEPLPDAATSGADGSSPHDFLTALSPDLVGALPEVVSGEPQGPSQPGVDNAVEPAPISASSPGEEAKAESAGPLSEIFDEFRADLDDFAAGSEDLETHYNLGVAYREMGLTDEAISEFQKVAKANQNGKSFRYAMQCYTLLGLAFVEKGQPSIAAMWYERALDIPGLDQESVLALRYDLGVAQELAGDTAAARRNFSQVYGMNIDYRDVAERLAALGNGS